MNSEQVSQPLFPGITVCLVFLLFFGLYIHHSAPTITLGDSGELAAVGATLGIGHPPGYPLFAITGKIWTVLCPWATAAYRMNILSGFWCAAALAVLVLVIARATGSFLVGAVAAALLGLTPLWTTQAVVCEVFGLNSFLAAVLIGLLMEITVAPVQRVKAAYLSFLVLGVGLGNHHTLLMLVPCFLLALWFVPEKKQLRFWIEAFLCAATGSLIYLYIYLRAHQTPVMDWEEPRTLERFWKLVTRARYGTFQLAQGTMPGLSIDNLQEAVSHTIQLLRENFGYGALLVPLGLAGLFEKSHRRHTAVAVTAFLFSGPLFFWITQIHPTAHSRILLDRFFYLPMVPAIILGAIGLSQIISRIPENARAAVVVAAGILGMTVCGSPISERGNYYIHDFGSDFLHSVPSGALLFDDRADESEFSIAYLQRVENRRPDVQFTDCNAGVSLSLYGPDYYDIWGKPRLALRTARERSLIEASPHPVYYATHDPRMIPIERIQEGLVFAVAGHATLRHQVPWSEILLFRPEHNSMGLPSQWDRAIHADYLQMLADDARQNGNFKRSLSLYQGVFAYTNDPNFRQQMEKYLLFMIQHNAH